MSKKNLNQIQDTLIKKYGQDIVYVKRGKGRAQNFLLWSVLQEEIVIDLYLNKKLSTTDIATIFHLKSYRTIVKFLDDRSIKRDGRSRRIYKLNEEYFDVIDSYEKAYILGFFYADGSNVKSKQTISMSLQEEDKDILEKIRLCIGSDKPLEFLDYSNKHDSGYSYKNQYRLLLHSSHMCRSLERIGMVPNKSLCLEFPEIPEKYHSSFCRGYFDGDGCIHYDIRPSGVLYPSFSVTSTNDFCVAYKDTIKKNTGIDLMMSDASCHNGITKTVFTYGYNRVIPIMNWLYEDMSNLYLERKKKKYDELICKKVA